MQNQKNGTMLMLTKYNDTTLLHVQEILQKHSFTILRRNTHKPRGTTMVSSPIF